MTRVPLDIYGLILQSLSKHELTIMARVSRALRPGAEQILYKCLDIRWAAGRRTLREALDNRPDRRVWVRELAYRRYKDESTEAHLDAVHILQSLTSLTSLMLSSDLASWHPWGWLTSNKWPFSLQQFSCYPPDDHVGQFISSQPEIRYIRLGLFHSWQPKEISSTAIPYLNSAMLQGNLLSSFVPGRPVQRVRCGTRPMKRLNQILDPLKLSSGPLMYLSIQVDLLEDDATPMNGICTALPFLRSLTMTFKRQQRFPQDDWPGALSRHQHLRQLYAYWEITESAPNALFFERLQAIFPHHKIEWHTGRDVTGSYRPVFCSIQFSRPDV